MKKIILPILGFVLSSNLFAQQFANIAAMDNLLQLYTQSAERGAQDAEQVLSGYIAPLMRGIGFGLSNGWVNTAKPHTPGGFDITFTVNTAFVPDKDLFYTIGPLQEAELIAPGDGFIPTIFGPDYAPSFEHKLTGVVFDGMGGLDMQGSLGSSFVPTPMVQASLGLIKGTEISLRFFPPINNKQYGLKVNMFGLGGKHSLTQYIPGAKDSKLDISAFAGYTRFNFQSDLSDAKDGSKTGVFHVNSYTLQGIASTSFSIFTTYISAGFTRADLGLAFKGGYSIDGDPTTIEVTDPLDMKLAEYSPRGSIGFMMKFVALTIHADYTFQKYNTLTAGIGISIK